MNDRDICPGCNEIITIDQASYPVPHITDDEFELAIWEQWHTRCLLSRVRGQHAGLDRRKEKRNAV